MKVTIVLLAALVCFAAINAAPSEQHDPVDLYDDEPFLDEIFADDTYELRMYNIFSSFFWYLKAALRTLKGVNCTIKEVIRLKIEAELFIVNIHACGTDCVKSFKNVIVSCNKVIDTCNKIINLKEKVCNNDESTNENKSTTWSCTLKLFKQLYLLHNQVSNTVRAVKKIPAVPGEAADCTKNNVNVLIDSFNAFPLNVKLCSKLKN